MTTYTTAERHEIYKKALKNAENEININYGLCHLVSEINYNLVVVMYHRRYNLPEIDLFIEQTRLCFDNCNAWQVRKIILEFCIEMTSK